MALIGTVSSEGLHFRNRIINGDMRIDQRNAGASVSSGYPVDRWQLGASQSSKMTGQRNAGSVTPPSGFTNYLGITSSSAYSVNTTDYFFAYQAIEGFNAADLAWGSANAVAATLSFRVYSSLTGTFGGSIKNGSANRSYPFSYTISSANTWTNISITIPGDTSGTWPTDNSAWGYVVFGLGSGSTRLGTANTWAGANYDAPTGSVSVVGTNGATFYITGVQLEVGSVATPFERRPFGTELALCQRYYQIFNNLIAEGYASGPLVRQNFPMTFPVQMRATPTRTVITAGSYSNIRSSSSSYAGLGINGLTNTYASCSMESTSTGFMSMTNQTESMSAEL